MALLWFLSGCWMLRLCERVGETIRDGSYKKPSTPRGLTGMYEGNKQSEKKKRLSLVISFFFFFFFFSLLSFYCRDRERRGLWRELLLLLCSCLIFVRTRSAYHRRTCIQWARTTCQRHTDNATLDSDVSTGLMTMRCWWHFGRVVDWLATNTFTSRKSGT